jgi:AAA family ATP:ADP antiporter
LLGHLARLLNLEPGEMGKLLFLWALYMCFTAGLEVGDGVTQALFLKRVGVEYLPVMFAVKAALDILVALMYVPLAARVGHERTLTLGLAVAGAGLLALWWPARANISHAYVGLYAWNESTTTLLKIHWGVLLLDCFSGRDARRTFPFIYTGARLGAVMGGVVLTTLAHLLGAANLLTVAGGLLLASALLSLGLQRITEPAAEAGLARESAAGRIAHIREGLALGLRVPLVRAIAVATLFMVICRYGLRYRYSATFAASFGEAELAAFYGSYKAIANAGSIVVQLVITSRLLVYAGISLTNLSYAVCIFSVFLGLGGWPGLATAVLARLTDYELKAAIKTPLSNLFYGALPTEQRPAGRAFVLGLVVPVATAGASLMLNLEAGVRTITVWGPALAVLYLLATLWQNRTYKDVRRRASSG